MTHAELLKLLLPPESYDPAGPVLNVELAAAGATLDEVQARVADSLREADPRSVSETLTDWERVYGLPDPCVPLGQTFAQRVSALVAKVLEIGGLTRDYYIAQAASLGYPGASIEEFGPMTCNDECDDAVYSEAWRFVWRLNVPQAVTITNFDSNSPCADPLRAWGNAALECVMARIKPAHTLVLIGYGA